MQKTTPSRWKPHIRRKEGRWGVLTYIWVMTEWIEMARNHARALNEQANDHPAG